MNRENRLICLTCDYIYKTSLRRGVRNVQIEGHYVTHVSRKTALRRAGKKYVQIQLRANKGTRIYTYTWYYLGVEEGDARANACYRFGCGCTLVIYDNALSEKIVRSPRPCLKTMHVCMNTTTLLQVIGCFVDTIQSPCGPGAHTLFGIEGNAKKNEKCNSKNTASSSKLFFFFKEPAHQNKKNKKKQGEKLEKLLPLYLVYVSHQGRFGQPRTNWRRGRLQKAATTRDRCIVHMCASSVLSRRATSPAPAQRQNCRYFST